MSEINQGKMEAVAMGRKTIFVKMELLSDTIFGNGMSVPGEEDISVLTDKQGFPFYKGSTFKGLLREEMSQYLEWCGLNVELIKDLFGEGKSGEDDLATETRRLVFSDFVMSPHVRQVIYNEIGDNPEKILDCLSNIRAFTRISEEGTADVGSLRYARCINQGLVFYSTITCADTDYMIVKEVLPFVKWIGTLRNRGFGYVSIEEERSEGGEA